jgi:hypothetical protein
LMDKLEPYYLGNNQVNNTSITTLKDWAAAVLSTMVLPECF